MHNKTRDLYMVEDYGAIKDEKSLPLIGISTSIKYGAPKYVFRGKMSGLENWVRSVIARAAQGRFRGSGVARCVRLAAKR